MSRIRIVSAAGELELEGGDDFIGEYEEVIASMLEQIKGGSVDGATPTAVTEGRAAGSATSTASSEIEFGEALHQLPSGASGTDQILLAGQFAARASENNTFSTREANQLLLDQGVKLANASQSLKHNLTAKRVFKVEGRFRISKGGIEHLNSLVAQEGTPG